MKPFLLFFFATTLLCQGQIIDFPDPNFKTALLNNYPEVDTNGDGEIQINEAQSFDENLNLSDKNISDLTGIEYFVNTRWLYASRNNFIEVDLSNNLKLESIYLSNTNLSELNLSNNNDLYRITVTYNNELASITLPENPIYLHSIELQHNQLSSLDLNSLTQLQLLYCNNNQLTQLHLNNDNSLELDCSNNQLLDLTIISNSLTKFQKLKCTGNLFENLNLSESNVIYLDCGDNPLLENINWRNGLTSRFKPEFDNWNNFENLPNLNTVCYGPGYNQMFMDFVLAEVGHSVAFYNNETCDALSVNENHLILLV